MNSKWFQKGQQGSKMAPKSVLEGSGGHLGLKSQQELEKARSSPPRPPPLGCQDGGQNPSKSGQKSIKKSMIFCIAFYMASGSILGANLEGFGSQVEGHVDQNRDHMASCWQVGWNSKNLKKPLVFCMVFATSAMPCWGKKSIKIVPRALPKQLSNRHPNLHRFGSQLGSILGWLWQPSSSQTYTKSLETSIHKITKNVYFLDRSWHKF